ncbi:MAG: MBL fold metallo-hydrolase [Pseudomonadota bacterium]|mgnify:CR=1 FL=1|nr:MBL fold metallo-hydrolase [Pseudomonadota bacterium]
MKCRQWLFSIMLGGMTVMPAAAQWDPEHPATGNLRFTWIHGSISAKANTDVRVQVHRYNEHTFILRQNPAIHWEAPFMYLLMGEERAVLLDAGATEEAEYFPLRQVVDRVINRWQQANNVPKMPLLVLTLGSETSQIAALGQFENRPDTMVVGNDSVLRSAVLGGDWPSKGKLDLGGRVLDVLPTPGLDESAISVFDEWSGILFTGNTLYPGRLVIRDYARYLESLESLADLSRKETLRFVLGGRIEMSAEPGLDYMLRSNYRPNEHALQLTASDLQDATNIVRLIDGREDIHIHDDFIVMHGVGRGARAYGWPVYIPEQFRKNRTR